MKKTVLISLITLILFILPASIVYAQSFCEQAGAGAAECASCIGSGGFQTALGCISFSPEGFVSSLLTLGVGLAGGFALLLLLYGSFLLATSSGNPEQVQKGKEVASSAVIGLLFIILSVYIMNLIGVKILVIPDF